jgi:cytoskeletal protein RodZ
MLKDLLKTAAVVVVIGLIVIATFLYGKHQSEQHKDQAKPIQQQQSQQAVSTSQNSQPTSSTPPQPTPVPSSTAPATQPNQTSMPQTGGEVSWLPLGFLVTATIYYRTSRRQLLSALRAT